MPFKNQPADIVFVPKRYPTPDYEQPVVATRIKMPDDETVGYLAWQDPDRIEWFGRITPDHYGFAMRRWVSFTLLEGARDDVPVATAYGEILNETLHDEAEVIDMRKLHATWQ